MNNSSSHRITTFFVKGVPIPKGSAKAFKHRYTDRIIVTQVGGAKQKIWSKSIMTEALQSTHLGFSPDNPKIVDITFLMPRPKYHFNAKGEVKERYVLQHHVVKPDVDKLTRCVLDALDSKFYTGDQKVISANASKRYADGNPGAVITVSEVRDV